ncbi:MAG TPA: hypothetical protein VNJ70_00945 [Thermoanaerobaculia bacterium]|nr:hypothetical protein [Thermoanaerobaculia bacterium]
MRRHLQAMKPTAAAVTLAMIFFLAASAAAAEPVQPASPLDRVQSFRGTVEVSTEADTVLVVLTEAGGGTHLFRVETTGHPALPVAFRAEAAEVLLWRGHLVVIARRARQALHLSIPGALPPRRGVQLEQTPHPRDVEASLRASYDLTRIDTATAIISRSGPLALVPGSGGRNRIFEQEIDYDDPGGGGGPGGCGTACSISCGDGSSCSATCQPPRCARCSCPASCTCSF